MRCSYCRLPAAEVNRSLTCGPGTSLALYDRQSPDERFLRALPLVERGASDERNFVKKGVSWAMRAIGRRSATLRRQATRLAKRLAESESAPARWIGRDALRDLTKAR